MPRRGRGLFFPRTHSLTCQGLDARALKQPGRAVVVVQLLVAEVEARVDVAVLLRDLRIVKVRGGSCGGSHGGSQGGVEGRGRRRPASSGRKQTGMQWQDGAEVQEVVWIRRGKTEGGGVNMLN